MGGCIAFTYIGTQVISGDMPGKMQKRKASRGIWVLDGRYFSQKKMDCPLVLSNNENKTLQNKPKGLEVK